MDNSYKFKGDKLIYDPSSRPINYADPTLVKKYMDDALKYVNENKKAKKLLKLALHDKTKNLINKEKYENYMSEIFPDFANDFYGIFIKTIYIDKIDIIMYMLDSINKLRENKSDFYTEEKNIGELLADKFVKKK